MNTKFFVLIFWLSIFYPYLGVAQAQPKPAKGLYSSNLLLSTGRLVFGYPYISQTLPLPAHLIPNLNY